MPPTNEPVQQKSLHEVVAQLDMYPIEAFEFVREGLAYTVDKLHGKFEPDSTACRHVSGQQLCEGLREYALLRWGMLARTVLRRWDINTTLDFGRIIFAMVDNGLMQKTADDSVEDFRKVYDFKTAFEFGYRISSQQLESAAEGRA